MSHATADKMFNALAVHALGLDAAASLSLHSGRSWKASAVWSLTGSIDKIKASCRWATAQSAEIYTHMGLREHADLIDRAMSVAITPSLASECQRVCPLDIDEAIATLNKQIDRLAAIRNPTVATNTQPAVALAFRADVGTDHVPDPVDVDLDDDDGLPVDERPLADLSDLGPGSPVAVPFKHRTHGERLYVGCIMTMKAPRNSSAALVKFDEVDGHITKYVVDYDRLFVPVFPVA